ncbi:MAG: hypothetical protein KY460_12740 [Actinobacteria bacterium]|nr:hypothetical protein [Actinomycetota bacterium]
MKVDKMSLSFPAGLGEQIRDAARRAGMSASAWMAGAAREKLRSEQLRSALDDHQRAHGSFTAEELRAAERALGLGGGASDTA